LKQRSVGIVGTGLIGASIGMRARESGMRVVGYDADAEAAELARRRGALDEIVSYDEALQRDIVVLAGPVDATLAQLREPGMRALDAMLILDVASVKAPIVEAARGIATFVATHPMAGRERSGAGAADVTLFIGRSWAYVPGENAAANEAAQAFIREMGATPHAVDAAMHDRIVARTSHVPQLFAWLIARRLELDDADATDGLTGPVALELQRIAGSDKALWREILLANAGNVESELLALARAMTDAAEGLRRGEPPV
jgi:prephenate dehydrogenase